MNFLDHIKDCTECKNCELYCSIFLATGKYGPYEKLKIAEKILEDNEKEKPEGWETIFYCTKCEACDKVCLENIPISEIVDETRKIIVEKWGVQFERQKILTDNILKTGNPFGKQQSRLEWLKEPIKSESKTLLHLGCMLSYIIPEMGEAIIQILKKLNVDFTVSKDENCCGYFVYNTGNHRVAREIQEQNMKEFEKYDKIITACAGCTIFFKRYYGLNDKVSHVIEIIDEKLKNTSLIKPQIQNKTAIFHDSCHISRPFNIIEQPRNIMKLLGYTLKENNIEEFELAGKYGTCCGADGGMRIVNQELAMKIGGERVREASEKADIFFTLCPFCIKNFQDAAEKFNIKIEIEDILKKLNEIL
jgi:Fe-S oxidoreductase